MMKRFFAWTKRSSAAIPALCYALCLLAWLAASLFGLGRDAALKAGGRLESFTLPMESWTLVNMEQGEKGAWHTLTDDPQMHWQNPDGRAVRTLRLRAEFSKSPREMCLYYTTRPGEDFGQEKRVFAVPQHDGSYLYTLPAGRIEALRLDPCSEKHLDMTVEELMLNEPAGLVSYFSPGWYGAFQMILWPGLAASALSLLKEAFGRYKRKKENG